MPSKALTTDHVTGGRVLWGGELACTSTLKGQKPYFAISRSKILLGGKTMQNFFIWGALSPCPQAGTCLLMFETKQFWSMAMNPTAFETWKL